MPTIETLLEETSRTFAIAIPALPEPTRREVTIAYLLFRIADTFEDASHWEPDRRSDALREFSELLQAYSHPEAERLAAAWSAAGPSTHAGYRELIAEVPRVLAAFFALSPTAVGLVRQHVVRSANGMARYVERTRRGALTLTDRDDLRAYCYVVAGIVGEMLTELFLLSTGELSHIAPFLRARGATFGEALQLVNILKDSTADASEGRWYLPAGMPVGEVFALARADLVIAVEYIHALQSAGAPRGIVEFTALPVVLACEALDQVERHGPGSKVGRAEVSLLTRRLKWALEWGEPIVPGAGRDPVPQ